MHGVINRVFDPHGVAGLDQHFQHQIDRLLRAGDDHDLRGIAFHPTRRPQIARHRRAQRQRAARVAVAKPLRIDVPQLRGGQAAPDFQRALIQAAPPGVERQCAELRRVWRQSGIAPRRAGAAGGHRRLRNGRFRRGKWLQHVTRNEGARASAALGIALGDQLLIHPHHQHTRHAQHLRQMSRGGQAAARSDGPAEDHPAHLIVQLTEQRLFMIAIHRESQQSRPIRCAGKQCHAGKYAGKNWSAEVKRIGSVSNQFDELCCLIH